MAGSARLATPQQTTQARLAASIVTEIRSRMAPLVA